MSELWFDGAVGGDPEAVAFAAALNGLASGERWSFDPEDVWVQWLGAYLYLAVEVLPLKKVQGYGAVPSTLEVCFWPASAPVGRGVKTGWGNSVYPFDAQIQVRGGRVDIRDGELPVAGFAALTFSWVRDQLARPLELHRWSRPAASRIVLADSGDVIARRGLRLWRTEPDVVERLS